MFLPELGVCLSPEVDLVAGAALTVVAVDCVRHARSGRTLPIALLPGLFAVHSVTSAVVWWGLRGDVPAAVGDAAAQFYMVVAFALLPVYVPVAIALLEPPGWRRDALILLAGAGTVAGVEFLWGLASGSGRATACDGYVHYLIIDAATIASVAYVVAALGAMLISSQRPLVAWGVVNVVVVVLLVYAQRAALPSLWCGWAAATSVFVAWLMRRLAAATDEGLPWEEPPPSQRDRVPQRA